MADTAKIGKIILIAAIVILLALAGLSFALFQKEHARNVSLRAQLEDTQVKQRMAESRLEESKKMISELQIKLQGSQSQVDNLSSELRKEKDARQQALAQIDQLKSDLESQKEMRSALEKKIAQTQDDVNSTQSQLKELSAKKSALEQKLKELGVDADNPAAKPGVELGKIVVAPEAGKGPTPPQPAQPAPKGNNFAASPVLTGKIIVINKDYDFVVINLGTNDGVAVGSVFSVYHKDKYMGDIKVEKVHDAMSAAGFISAGIKDKLSEGDKVVLKDK